MLLHHTSLANIVINQFDRRDPKYTLGPFSLNRTRFKTGMLLSLLVCTGSLVMGCIPFSSQSASLSPGSTSGETVLSLAENGNNDQYQFLQASWESYRERFIQADGRVIDWETADQRTTSEGQAYAMLRAVFIDDPETFEKVLLWGEQNLARRSVEGEIEDTLWAWKWGPDETETWGILDRNFASDADVDTVTALILASRRWNRDDYLTLAQTKLADLWDLSTVQVEGEIVVSHRYFLPGPQEAFRPTPTVLYLNPSYLAPYAFRLFDQIDPNHDWHSLVESSYQVLEESASLSSLGLPSNWVALDLETEQYSAIPDTAEIKTLYSFDAYRVWWRIALDAAWFQSTDAEQYLQQHLPPLMTFLEQQKMLPAEIDLAGQTITDYESTAQYAMVYHALNQIDPDSARALRQEKLDSAFRDGFWDSDSAYYTQNLAWLGVFPPTWIPITWLQGQS